ncbi:MAG TPA: adenosylmethionine--8-amino-7-oxononanoate transaminase [Hydrogenobaculum sp.]|nr:adenosylmethionine--8-amino-7-oxononanoate transaminase [Hydrogenobaculum sp.]
MKIESLMFLESTDRTYFWHPFTQMKVYEEEGGIIFERGEGVYLYDIYGNKYIDAISSLWCNIHGHNHPKLNEALINQLNKVAHTTTLGNSNVPAIMLSKKLVDITPSCLQRVFYSEDGAEAMEIAIKLSYHYFKNLGQERPYFISFEGAYHGDTIGSVSVGSVSLFHDTYKPLLFKTYKLPSPYIFSKSHHVQDLLDMLEKLLKDIHDKTSAIVMESGMQAASGFLVYPKGFMKSVYEMAKHYGVLFIADEVATGFGRTGSMFYVEQEGICPDFMALGKGITGGYMPLAATLTTKAIYDAFLGEYEELKHFFHGHTYTGNNLACAVALKNIEIFEEENVLGLLKEKINYLEKRLKEFESLKHVKETRQLGFMAAVELAKDKKEPYEIKQRIGFKVANYAKKKGVFLRPLGNNMTLVMPLSIGFEEMDKVLDVLYESVKAVTEEL